MKAARDIINELYNNDVKKFDDIVYNGIKTKLPKVDYKLDDVRFKERFEAELKNSGYPFTADVAIPETYSIDLSKLDFGVPSMTTMYL